MPAPASWPACMSRAEALAGCYRSRVCRPQPSGRLWLVVGLDIVPAQTIRFLQPLRGAGCIAYHGPRLCSCKTSPDRKGCSGKVGIRRGSAERAGLCSTSSGRIVLPLADLALESSKPVRSQSIPDLQTSLSPDQEHQLARFHYVRRQQARQRRCGCAGYEGHPPRLLRIEHVVMPLMAARSVERWRTASVQHSLQCSLCVAQV